MNLILKAHRKRQFAPHYYFASNIPAIIQNYCVQPTCTSSTFLHGLRLTRYQRVQITYCYGGEGAHLGHVVIQECIACVAEVGRADSLTNHQGNAGKVGPLAWVETDGKPLLGDEHRFAARVWHRFYALLYQEI